VTTNRIAFCSASAMGLNMHEQPPSITVSFLASIRATAEALEHVSPTVDNLPALEHEVQEHARAQDVDFWTAAAAVTGEPGFTRHAPPPDAPGLDETVRDALRLARERDVDFIDGAQLAMYEHQLADVGVGSDHWRGLRDVREVPRARTGGRGRASPGGAL
jgi:hypothetical protein